MSNDIPTIEQTVRQIRSALRDYIEATYHVSHPVLVKQRRHLLDEPGAISQQPFIESTPRYLPGARFEDLDIPEPARELLSNMAQGNGDRDALLHNPPYRHQSRALEAALGEGRSLVVTTGTGSGKTETFLLPILGALATEARTTPDSFSSPAIRALLLYPMNALVNDQLGRLRLLFGDPLVADTFKSWAKRPARFARYTSRTLYPGVRTTKKDQDRLRSIGDFYIGLLEQASDPEDPRSPAAGDLIQNLKVRGKWPSKPDLAAWYGISGSRWLDKNGAFKRAVTLEDDPELLTRHEVLASAPDLLVTNYSMLEYMLMRPLERPVFDQTRQWLADNPDQRLLLIIDEAHLYRGAAGTEVALLLRRLRDRLGVDSQRLQVICTSASFHDADYAAHFAASLSGKAPDDFETLTGDLALRPSAETGTSEDVEMLAEISLRAFYESDTDIDRTSAVERFLRHRGADTSKPTAEALFDALESYPPMSKLVNSTMVEARPLPELGAEVFPDAERGLQQSALSVLTALGSTARRSESEPGLLPCRVHTFFRGLPGIWACLDEECSVRDKELGPGPVGKIYSQPKDTCSCGSRVFELYTCRNCGAAYARAYTDDVEQPSFLWAEPGASFVSAAGVVPELQPLDLLLERPSIDAVEPADLDLVTGRLGTEQLGSRSRSVFLRGKREQDQSDSEDDDEGESGLGEFRPCGVCDQQAAFGRTSVQDHQTKGDQPFQALISRQLQVQPPSPKPATEFAPLRGRKVLVFSDSRQTAARLAPNLQDYSMRDALRPLILRGWRDLEEVPGLQERLSLDDLLLAVLIASQELAVRLRPKLKGTESLHIAREVQRSLKADVFSDPMSVLDLVSEVRRENPPESLLRAINETLTSPYFGLQSLALASVRERGKLTQRLVDELPDLPVASGPDQKVALARVWIGHWAKPGYWFRSMTPAFWMQRRGVRPHSGRFDALAKWFGDKETKSAFNKNWLPALLEIFTESVASKKHRILAQHLSLELTGSWAYCQACRSTQRPFPGNDRCVVCYRAGTVVEIDPDSDPVFAARKGYYRSGSIGALSDPPVAPVSLIAAEHTAQLNAAQSDEVFSRAEQYELLFQDVDTGVPGPGERARTAIDVLSCTTTMEVGIDIGTLSGVALRNMPPSRASYQQRAGRAGRRGNAVATVLAFGSADSHDERYFREPDQMVRGRVDDPILTLDNSEIAQRHVTAYLLQRYHEARLPAIDPEDQPQLFEVLGTVRDFVDESSPLNRPDFEGWLRSEEAGLQAAVEDWLPTEIDAASRGSLLADLVDRTLEQIDKAIPAPDEIQLPTAEEAASEPAEPEEIDEYEPEVQPETGEEQGTAQRNSQNLLDRLLYKGVLPRYAFPTDVVSFHVFDKERSTRFRPAFEYSPSQGLPVALSQYAPGKEVWVDGKLWSSGALYSPMQSDRFDAWRDRRLYFECSVCHYAKTSSHAEADRGETQDCPACGSHATFGAAKNWMRPPGFAHPQALDEGTSPEDQPAKSYATRAKLVAESPADPDRWVSVTPSIRQYFDRTHLLVTNSGPRREGYTYCTRCGSIAPTASPGSAISAEHPKPFPDEREPNCPGSAATRGLVLGTDFISDVLLIGLQVEAPLTLQPGYLATDVALRTLSEGLTIAGCRALEIEPGELQAEYRPALTPGGHSGREAEIYMYDTLAGGAGFARRIGELGVDVFTETLELLAHCPSDCDRSCYRCLRNFRNRFEHDLLDRHVGATLLRYLLDGSEPELSKSRLDNSTDRLCEDLNRHGLSDASFLRNEAVEIPGLGTVEAPILATRGRAKLIIALHTPLTPDHAADPRVRDAAEFSVVTPVLLIDEILVSRHLPGASRQALAALGL